LWHRLWKPAVGLLILGAIGLLAVAAMTLFDDMSAGSQAFVYYTVESTDLPIVVTERGNLESQLETTIRCEVENSSFDRSGNQGTQIIFIVPNGSAVKEGELLVELDSAAIRNGLDSQQLAYDKSVSQHIQDRATYDNQITQNQTDLAQAELRVELAKLNLEMYMDDESGTFKLAMDDVGRQIDETKNSILEAQAALQLAKTEKSGIEALFKLGYRGKSDLETSYRGFLRAEGQMAASVNQLSTFHAMRKQLANYEYRMKELELEGDVATAVRGLTQVRTDNEAKLAKALAAKVEAEKTEAKEKERLDKLNKQLELCKIFAPHDGMAVYARENSRYGNSSEIAEGVTVRERQQILSLPDLSQMQVKTQIHEAVLDQVKPGLPVTVKIDAFPNRTYNGVVHQVAVVPTTSYYTSVKTYECIVQILERVESLKPGMTAVVDIHVDRLRGILSIPVQAVVQVNKESWCYVHSDEGIERRLLKLGRSNDKFVHVLEGLSAGNRVILNTDAIFDESQNEVGEISPEAGASEAPDIPPEAAEKATSNTKKLDGNVKFNPGDRPRGKGKQGSGSGGGPKGPRGGN
jgi:HlyD family secretion protein